MSSPMLYNNTFSNTAMEISIASNFPQPPRCLSRRAIIYCRLAKQRSEKNTPPKTPKTRYFCSRRINQSFGFSGQSNTIFTELTAPSYYQRPRATSHSMERGTSPCDTAGHAEEEEEHSPGFRRRSSGRPVNFLAPVHPVTDSDDPPEPGSALTAVPQRDPSSLGWNSPTARNRHRGSDAGASSGVVVPVIHISPDQRPAGRENEEENQVQESGRGDNNNNNSSIRNNASNRSTQSEKGMIVVESTDVDVPEGIANVLSPRLAQVAHRVYGPFTAELLDLFAVSIRRTILHEAASVSGVLVNQVQVAELFLEPDGSLVFIVTVKPTKPEERDWTQALLLDSTFPSTRVYLKQLRQRSSSTPTTAEENRENWPSQPPNLTEESKKLNRKGKRKRKEAEPLREGKKGVGQSEDTDDEVSESTPPRGRGLEQPSTPLSRGSSTIVGRTTKKKRGALKGKKAAAALGKERDANKVEHKHQSEWTASSSSLSSPSSSVWNSTADGEPHQKKDKKKKKKKEKKKSERSGRHRQVSRDSLEEESDQDEKEPATSADVDDGDHPVSEIAAEESEEEDVDALSDARSDTGRKTREEKGKKNNKRRNKNKKRSKGKKKHTQPARREDALDASSSTDSDNREDDDDDKGESEEERERPSTPSTQVVELSSEEDDDDDDRAEMEAKGRKQKNDDRNAEDSLLSPSAASFSSSAVVGRKKKKSTKKRTKKKKNARDTKKKKAKNNEEDDDDNNTENNDLYDHDDDDDDDEPKQKKKKTKHSSGDNAMKNVKKKKNERREGSSGRSSSPSTSSSPRHRTPPRVQPLDMSELGTGATPLTMRSSRPSLSPSVGRRSTSRSRRLRVIQKPPWVSPLDDPEVKRMVEERARIEREQALEKVAASAAAAMAAATPKQRPQPQTPSVLVSTSPQADPHSVSSSPEMQRSAPAPAPAPTSAAFLSTPEPTPREREAPPPPPVQLNRAAVVAATAAAVPDAQAKQNRGNVLRDPQPRSYGISGGNISESDSDSHTSPVREHSFSHAIGDGFLLIDVVYPNTRGVSQSGKGGGQAKADRGDVKQLELFFDGTAGTLTGRDVRAYVAEYLGAAPQHIQLRYKEKEVSDGTRGAQLGWSNGSLVEAFPPKHLKNAPEQPTISTGLNVGGMTINGMRLRQRGLIRTRTPQGWSSDTDFESSGGGSTSSAGGGVRSPPSPVERRRNQGGHRTPEPAVLQRQLDNRRLPTGDQSGGAWGSSSSSSSTFPAAAMEEDDDDIYPQPYRATPTLPTSVIPSPLPPAPPASTSIAPSPQRSASRQSTGSAGEVHGISIRPSSTLERRRRLAFGGGAGREDGVAEKTRHTPAAAAAGRHQPTLTPPGMGAAGMYRGRDFHSERMLKGDDETPHPQSLGVRPNPYR